MSLYRDDAVVLRTQKLGEADRIVTVLSHRHGRIRAVAKGVRRTTSRFGARLEPFNHVDLQLAEGRSLHVVTQVESLPMLTSSAGPLLGSVIGADYRAYTAGTAMLEAADRLAGEDLEPAVQQYLLLVGGLRVLAAGERDPSLVLDAFLLRSLAVAGYAPSFGECARCGVPGPHRSFSPSMGGMACSSCRPPGSASPTGQTVALLSALLTGDWTAASASDDRTRREGAGLVAAYLQWHLERGLRSLTHVDR